MSIQNFNCKDGCCTIKIKKYEGGKCSKAKYGYNKAGVFVYSPKEDRVLLVQSRGHLWGPPKGTMNFGEDEKSCAVREVKEEAGLDIKPEKLERYTRIMGRAKYYYVELDLEDKEVGVQDNMEFEINDANGISWIKMKCLEQYIENGNIVLNHHARILFYRFMNKVFPRVNWTTVKRKRRRNKF